MAHSEEHKKYYSYKAVDYLNDDFFLESMFDPTPESEQFWRSLLCDDIIDKKEFASACVMFTSLRKNQPKVSEERIAAVWQRITETNRKNSTGRRKFRIFYYAAASVVAVLAVSALFFEKLMPAGNPVGSRTVELTSLQAAISPPPSEHIEIVAGNTTLMLEGVAADVEYNITGKVRVNKKDMVIEAEDSIQTNQLRVPYGKRAFLKLSDGTSLWVNSGSTVLYPAAFSAAKREIFVEGQIYAHVAYDADRPFIVSTSSLEVKVLGTEFDVSAYKDEPYTNVVLVNGSVNVKPKTGKTTTITSNQMYSLLGSEATLRTVDVGKHISWKDGIYIFENESIENVLMKLPKYYNVTMTLPSEPSGITCSGKLVLQESIQQILQGLSEITSMTYVLTDDECIVIKFDKP